MDPTRCEGGCGRWVHHPKRRAASRRKRFCSVCERSGKRLTDTPPRVLSKTPAARKARRKRKNLDMR